MATDFKLVTIDNKLALTCTNSNLKFNPIFVDFSSNKLNYRIKHGGSFRQAIARAIGIKPNKTINVIDATAGLGQDAFIMASCGANITLIERNNTIYQLLNDGLKRGKKDPAISSIIKKIILYQGDSIDIIPKISKKMSIDVIYLDPMFPEKSNTALPKKELIALRNIVKGDLDEDQLFDTALKNALFRVVVKRAKLSPYIKNMKPNHSYIGKANRFDVYLTNI